MLTHASHSFSALTSWLFIGIRLSLKLSHWHDHSFCPIVLLFFLQLRGFRNLWLRKQVSVWCVADTASLLFGSGLLLLGLGDWYLHPRPQAVVPAVGQELLYNGLD